MEEGNYCDVIPGSEVNPLRLNYSADNNESEPENLVIMSNNNTESPPHSRRRRDAEFVVKPNVVKGSDEKERRVVTMVSKRF